MTREPDRFEEKAKELCLTEWRPIADALRRSREDALNEAKGICRRVASEEAPRSQVGKHAALRCEELIGYAMKSPAAAPAAETCPEPPPGLVETLEKVHGMGCGNIATHRIPAPPSEPAAPAPDLCQRCGKLGGHVVDFRFGGMLMGSWICPHCLDAQEKRIAALEAALLELSRRASDPDLYRRVGASWLMLDGAVKEADALLKKESRKQ